MQETPALKHIVTSGLAAKPHTSDRRLGWLTKIARSSYAWLLLA